MGNRSKRPLPPRLVRAQWAEYDKRWSTPGGEKHMWFTIAIAYISLFLGGLYHAL